MADKREALLAFFAVILLIGPQPRTRRISWPGGKSLSKTASPFRTYARFVGLAFFFFRVRKRPGHRSVSVPRLCEEGVDSEGITIKSHTNYESLMNK